MRLRAARVGLALLWCAAAPGASARLLTPANPPRQPRFHRATAVAAPLGLCGLIRGARPALVPKGPGPTTACIGTLPVTRSSRPVARCCSVVTHCQRTICVETLRRRSGAPIESPAALVAELAHDYGARSEIRSAVVVAGEWKGFLSLWRGASSYFPGAAYSNNQLRCELHHTARGRIKTLHTLIGARAPRALRAAQARLRAHPERSRYRFVPGSFRLRSVPGGAQILLCAVARHHRDAAVLEIPVPGLWSIAPNP